MKSQKAIVSKVLSPALQLWLRSQLDLVEDLSLKITSGDRQILRGYVPEVLLAASNAVYQGLHLGQVQLRGENIRLNLAQVIKGKPLRLLEPVPVAGQIQLKQADLAASILSPLLANALTDLLATLLAAGGNAHLTQTLQAGQMSWQEVAVHTNKLMLKGTLTTTGEKPTPVTIRTGLEIASTNQLRLYPLHIETLPELPGISLEEFQIDLGSEVELKEICLTPGQLFCRGGLRVLP